MGLSIIDQYKKIHRERLRIDCSHSLCQDFYLVIFQVSSIPKLRTWSWKRQQKLSSPPTSHQTTLFMFTEFSIYSTYEQHSMHGKDAELETCGSRFLLHFFKKSRFRFQFFRNLCSKFTVPVPIFCHFSATGGYLAKKWWNRTSLLTTWQK